jgi:hypothetical protein
MISHVSQRRWAVRSTGCETLAGEALVDPERDLRETSEPARSECRVE